MYQLNEDEIMSIESWLEQEPLHNRGLRNELLDHICCTIETLMGQGHSLEAAYHQAFNATCPNGMTEIEEEAFFLLTFHKLTNMKRVLFSTGFLSAFLLSFGSLFKLMHWPYATATFTAGLIVLLITLVALTVNTSYTLRSLSTATRVRVITGLCCGVMLVAGSMFKILHYPGANILLLSGITLLNLVFLPMFFYQLYRKSVAVS